MRKPALCALAIFLGSSAARANDSEAEIAIGGLTLLKSDAIAMDSEDLFVSRDKVRVAYRFTNMSDASVETLVAFPLPDIPPAQEENAAYWSDPDVDLKFRTRVDGKPVALERVDQALFKGQDVSERLRALKIPLNHADKNFDAAVKRLPKAARDKLVTEGLLRTLEGTDPQDWSGGWSLRTSLTRHQTFPARQSVTVEHEYVPRAGASVGGALDPQTRKRQDYFEEEKRKFCIDNDWLASFDKKYKSAKNGDGLVYSEIWIGYVLTTGANWKGPIGEFRLVVDKGKVDSLVSFCASDVKKISPTQFETRRKNFTPDRDLNVLIVDWAR